MGEPFTINMIGGGFHHALSSCGYESPVHVIWDKNYLDGSVSIHIDEAILNVRPDPSKLNIAWFAESPYFVTPFTQQLENQSVLDYVLNNYKYVCTSDKAILKKYPSFKYVIPTARPWVREKKIFDKTKWVSIIASDKNQAPGHQLRHVIIDKYKDNIDVLGRGYWPIIDKGEGLNNYLYSFAIENTLADGYFTEKISDCFATGTIPIYWGDNTISDYFLEEGIVRLENNFDPNLLTVDFYNSKKDAIEENFRRVINLPIPEDYIYLNYIR